jgi:hypothetical protein
VIEDVEAATTTNHISPSLLSNTKKTTIPLVINTNGVHKNDKINSYLEFNNLKSNLFEVNNKNEQKN